MELVPWRPFGEELGSVPDEMHQLWSRFFGEIPSPTTFGEQWSPSMDISETEDKLLVRAELPGIDVKDLDLSISGGLLVIKGEKKREEEEKDEHHYCTERHYGSFQRTIELPTSVQGDKVEATFNKRILKVTLPKAEEARKKEIKIEIE